MSILHLAPALALSFWTPAAPPPAAGAGTSTVRGHVWVDLDRDGLQGAGESGLAGVEVTLLDAYGLPVGGVDPVLTDAQGDYALDAPADGEYRVAFTRPDGYRFTRSAVGGRDGMGVPIDAESAPDDSDLNLANGYLDPGLRGPRPTGMTYEEITRIDANGDPWPINAWIVYPAQEQAGAPRSTVRDLYRDDPVDLSNSLAMVKVAFETQLGGDPDHVFPSDPDEVLVDTLARVDAPLATDGPFPVLALSSGLTGSVADMVSMADRLASRGYVAICLESSAFHTVIALGARYVANGGPYAQADFDHVPQLGGNAYANLLALGYQTEGYITGAYLQSFALREQILQADAMATFDAAEGWNAQAGHRLEGLFDFDHLGWIGFSAGAGSSAPLVRNDPRVDLVANIDSATFLSVPKPFVWIGNTSAQDGVGPTLTALLPNDFHGNYIRFPGVRFVPDLGPNAMHREFQHDFRDFMLAAFSDYFLKDVLACREDLGLEGERPMFDGYVGPYRRRNFAGWHTAGFELAGGADVERDAGVVPTRLWAVDGNQVSAIDTVFLDPDTDPAPEHVTPYGTLLVADGSQAVPLTDDLRAIAFDAFGTGWFVAGAPQQLYRLDTVGVLPGSPLVAHSMGAVEGLAGRVQELALDVRGGRLLALVGLRARRLASIDLPRPGEGVATRTALDLGELAAGMLAPSGLDLDTLGRPWLVDAEARRVARFDAGAPLRLESLALDAVSAAELAFDGVSKLAFFLDRQTATLSHINLRSGNVREHGPLATLGLGAEAVLAFERAQPTRFQPWIDAEPEGAAPFVLRDQVLRDVRIPAPPASWEGFVLRAQVVEKSGHASADRLTLAGGGRVGLGALVEAELDAEEITEAREVLFDGQPVAWLETDFGLSVGGTNLLPLHVVFRAEATTAAVEAVIESVLHSGPGPEASARHIALELRAPGGERGSSLELRF